MSDTRKEAKISLDQMSTVKLFPTPSPGTSGVLTTLLPGEIKKSPLGTFTHGVGNIVHLTEMIENVQNNLNKGDSLVKASLGAASQSVAEKLVEGVGRGLFAEGLLIGGAILTGAVSAPVTIPALAITSGVLLMAKSKEAGELANQVVPILVDTTLDKLKHLQISMTDFIKKAYNKFTRDASLKNAQYQNIEVAMVKLDYLGHLEAQGIYKGLDKNQRLLYNWIARETFSDYFQLNEKGQLKNIKSAPDMKVNKINGEVLKNELATIQSALIASEEKYNITADSKQSKCSVSLTDQEIGDHLLKCGVSPLEVAELYSNPCHVKTARHAISYLKDQEKQLICAVEAQQALEIIQGMQHFFSTLTQVGMFAHSKGLMTVGQVGFSTMQMAGSIVKLSSAPFTFSSIEPMSMLLTAGMSLISTVLGFQDDSGELEAKRAEQLQNALYTISRQIEELHGRFDRIEGMLSQLSGMINQVLHNQQILSDQIRGTYQLVRTGFQWVQTFLHDFRAENRHFHEHLNKQFSYLISLTEHKELQTFNEEVKSRLNYINRMVVSDNVSDLVKKEFVQLESDIKKCCSRDWNGLKEFSILHQDQNGDKPRDLLLPLQFLRGRLKNQEDALGFLAEEIEQVTGKKLDTSGIRKELLPATSLWFYLIFNYIHLSTLPHFESLRNPTFIAEMETQANNLLKFLSYMKSSDVVKLLLKKQEETFNEFQKQTFERFAIRRQLTIEDKKSETKKNTIQRLGDYFSSGEDKALIDEMCHTLDYYYFLLVRLSHLAGYSKDTQLQMEKLTRSVNLLTQAFDFNEWPAPYTAGSYFDSHFTAYSLTPWRHSYPYMHESLEKFAGIPYRSEGEEKMLFTSLYAYSSDWNGGASAHLCLNQLDILTGKQITINNIHPFDIPKKPTFPLSEYKGNFNQSANHVWASFHLVDSWGIFDCSQYRPSLIWFSGGSGYVSIYDIQNNQWSTVSGTKSFHVPLDYSNTAPTKTAYTNIIRGLLEEPYLLVNEVEWNKEQKEAYVRFNACDLNEKTWLKPEAIDDLFVNKVVPERRDEGWVLKSSLLPITPNQFFIKLMKVFAKKCLVYGLINPKNENTEIQMHYSYLGSESKEKRFIDSRCKTVPVLINQIYQTACESYGYSDLTLILSIKTKDGKNKLLFINTDMYSAYKSYETYEYELPPVHSVADWQAMQTIVVTIMGKPHIIVTLLDPEYHMMIFCYDPSKKKDAVIQLPNGPTLEFLIPDNRINFHWHCDPHLQERRNSYPGFYPVNTISIKAYELENMSTLMISYPKPSGSSQYFIQVQRYPLMPHLKIESSWYASVLVDRPEEKDKELPSRLKIGAELSQHFLKTMPRKAITSHTLKTKMVEVDLSPDLFAPAMTTCKQIQALLSDAMTELKLSESMKQRVNDELKKMSIIIATWDEPQKNKVSIDQLQDIYKIILLVDGRLRLDKDYREGIGRGIDRQVEQLKEEIADIKKKSPFSESTKLLTTKGFFSDGAAILALRKKLESNVDFWTTSRFVFISQSESLVSEAKKWELTCKDMKHDGNCFFHAIADQLTLRTEKKAETHVTLREKAIDHILGNSNVYKNFIDEDFNIFINKNVENRAWADNVMITALARTLNVTIVILRSDHAHPTIIKQQKPSATLYIGYEVGSHYQSLQGESRTLKAEIDRAEVDNVLTSTKSHKR